MKKMHAYCPTGVKGKKLPKVTTFNHRVRGRTLKVEQFWIAPTSHSLNTIEFKGTNNTLTVTGGEQNANRNFVNENFDNPVNLKKRKPTKQGD